MWRRSYDIPPPDLDKASEHYPGNDPKYAMLDEACLPTTESLYTTALRVIPYWQSVIVPDIKGGKKVLIAAHGNSLRALVQVRGAPVSRARRRSRARARARARLPEGARSVRAAHAPAPQYLDNISNDEITELNIPTACPLVCVAQNPGRVRVVVVDQSSPADGDPPAVACGASPGPEPALRPQRRLLADGRSQVRFGNSCVLETAMSRRNLSRYSYVLFPIRVAPQHF